MHSIHGPLDFLYLDLTYAEGSQELSRYVIVICRLQKLLLFANFLYMSFLQGRAFLIK